MDKKLIERFKSLFRQFYFSETSDAELIDLAMTIVNISCELVSDKEAQERFPELQDQLTAFGEELVKMVMEPEEE